MGFVFVAYLFVHSPYATWLENIGLDESYRRATLWLTPVALIIIAFIWWAIKTRLPTFSDGKPGILLALPSGGSHDAEVRRVLEQLKQKIGSRGDVDIKVAPPNLAPASETQAHSLRERSRAKLIVWGHVERGTFSDGSKNPGAPATIFKKISFSYQLKGTQQVVAFLGTSVSHALAGKRFLVRDSNDVFDRDFVAYNIDLVSRYVVAVSLATHELYDGSIRFFDGILSDVDGVVGLHGKFSKQFKIMLRRVFSTTLALSTRPLGSDKAFPDSAAQKEIRSRIQKALAVDPTNPISYLGMAIVHFWSRDLYKARAQATKALKVGLINDPSPFLSLAFLDFYEGEMVRGWKNLRQAVDRGDNLDAVTLFGVIHFYDDVLDKEPQRFELLFPLGIINKEFLDPARAKVNLEEFREKLESSEGRPQHERGRLLKITGEQLAELSETDETE